MTEHRKDVTFGECLTAMLFLCVPLSLFIGAGVLAFHGLPGWGWFLFVGVITIPSIKLGSKQKGDE